MYYDMDNNKKLQNKADIKRSRYWMSLPKEPTDSQLNSIGIKKISIIREVADEYQIVKAGEVETINGVPTITEYLVDKTLDTIKNDKCAVVDKQTSSSILKLAGITKQRNYLAKYNELLEKKYDGIITDDEAIQMNELKSLWNNIETLVNSGNAKEAEIMGCSTIDELKLVV